MDSGPPISFVRDVRPIFASRCFRCHGPDETGRKGGLRLDQEEGVARVVVAGSPERSKLWQRVSERVEARRMPPPGDGQPLDDAEVEVLARWIRAGARWSEHWAFVPPVAPEVPGGVSPIDALVSERLRAEGLALQQQADPLILARRLYLDVTGLPPTPEEADAFAAEPTDAAYEALVDRLLSSRRHAEHLARDWLDAARFSDTHGFQTDEARAQWPWRDWVIHAIETNLPFDRFTVEQLAGDLLPDATEDQRLATAFSRNHPISAEGGIIDAEYRLEYAADRVNTAGEVWMGLTFGCARCHDHKFDPIPQKDYYALVECFSRLGDKGKGDDNDYQPVQRALSPLQREALAEIDRRLAELDVELAGGEAPHPGEPAWRVLTPRSASADSGAPLSILPGGDVRAEGKAALFDAYELVLDLPPIEVTAIELRALDGDGGPGRGLNANFVVTRVDAVADGKRVEWIAARADVAQDGYPPDGAIDEDGATGWAISTGGADHGLVLTPSAPFRGTRLALRIEQQYGTSHLLGRFQVRASSDALAGAGARASPEVLLDQWRLVAGPPPVQAAARERVKLARTRRRFAATPPVMIMSDASPSEVHVAKRGRYDDPGDPVRCTFPTAFPAADGLPKTRLGLASWLVRPDHPLTARVEVNRLWQHYFHAGLVRTPEDFGVQGEAPALPKVLDWLAVELVRSGWDTRRIERLIVTSRAYRQSSRVSASADPDARLISRGPRGRLAAEVIRDQALFASGLLVERAGGPSVLPYHPGRLWEELNDRPGKSVPYRAGRGEDLHRRSLYSFWKRTLPPVALAAFDAPGRETAVVRRAETTTPLQALVLLDDPQMIEAARALAARMIAEGHDTPSSVERGFRRVLVRRPSAEEVALLVGLHDEERAELAADPEQAARLLAVGWSGVGDDLDPIALAAMTTVARVILNSAESIEEE